MSFEIRICAKKVGSIKSMNEYSEFIVKTMKTVDEMISDMDYRSMDRYRLHISVNRALCANVKKLMVLNSEEQKNEVNNIFISNLMEELLRKL